MQDCIFVKDGRQKYQIFFSELQYVESAHRYVKFVTAYGSFLREGSLCDAEKELPANQFCRIHRNHIISFRYSRQMDPKNVYVAGRQLPIGKQYRGSFLSKIAMTYNNTMPEKNAGDDLTNQSDPK